MALLPTNPQLPADIQADLASPPSTGAGQTSAQKSFSLDNLLNLGVQVAGAVGQARTASGAKADRQARIAACGRRPLLGKQKKREYDQCVANASMAQRSTGGGSTPPPSTPPPPSSNNMTIVLIGVGLLAVGGLAYFLLKKK
jgi:LPXTG-motif cell wall-anchored protein